MSEDIRKRLGLGYKRSGRGMEQRDFPKVEAEDLLREAILVFGPKVLAVLAQEVDRTAGVFHLVDQLGESVSTLNPVIDALREDGYVDVLSEDMKGDHVLRLTDRGAKVAGAYK